MSLNLDTNTTSEQDDAYLTIHPALSMRSLLQRHKNTTATSSTSNPSSTTEEPHPQPSRPFTGNFPSYALTLGGGVAIFHLASQRVVLCYHTRDKYWFLPKGRRDAGEESGRGAEREGFEESGYRNRLLPVPVRHRQPTAQHAQKAQYAIEPVWTQFMPVGSGSQYICFWYVAETLPPVEEAALSSPTTIGNGEAQNAQNAGSGVYQPPPPYPANLTLRERIKLEPEGYEPPRHANTGVDEEELLYESYLLPIEDARSRLGNSISADVVRVGWDAICRRMEFEE